MVNATRTEQGLALAVTLAGGVSAFLWLLVASFVIAGSQSSPNDMYVETYSGGGGVSGQLSILPPRVSCAYRPDNDRRSVTVEQLPWPTLYRGVAGTAGVIVAASIAGALLGYRRRTRM